MSQEHQDKIDARLRSQAEDLVRQAMQLGRVITINLEPTRPLEMGAYLPKIELRPIRNSKAWSRLIDLCADLD